MTFQNDTFVEYPVVEAESEAGMFENIDLISVVLVVFVVFICLTICCMIGKHRKNRRTNQADETVNVPETDSYPATLDHTSGGSNLIGVNGGGTDGGGMDRSILRDSPSTPESPPPSYYITADRGQSFQSYISQTSSQVEIPPSYDEIAYGRTSLASTSIPEEPSLFEGEPDVTEGGGERSGGGDEMVGGRGARKGDRKNRKSEPVSCGSSGKEKKKRRTKSDLIKERKKRTPSSATDDVKDSSSEGRKRTYRHHEEAAECLLRSADEGGRDGESGSGAIGGGVKGQEGGGDIHVSMPTRFSKRDSIPTRFTPV